MKQIITVLNQIYLSLSGLSGGLKAAIFDRLTFQNPAFVEAKRMGRWTGNIPRLLRFYKQESNGNIVLPRGFLGQLIRLCRKHNVRYTIDDRRRELKPVDFTFQGKLKPFQEDAVGVTLRRDFGTLSALTGSGKTVMALYVVAKRRQPALIVVHTKELLNQWADRIETFLRIPKAEIGIIGGGKKRIGDRVTVALVQSLYRCADKVSQHIGFLIVDECHRAPARTFTEAVTSFDSRYMLGLSATPWRRDRLSRLIYWHLGDCLHKVEPADLQKSGDILRAEVIIRETAFIPQADPVHEYSQMLSELTTDPKRNHLIASEVAKEASNGGGICLVLSDRKGHCEMLRSLLVSDFYTDAAVLTGDTPGADREQIVYHLQAGRIRVLIATGQLIGEGFDCPGLSTLFLATPVKFSGRVLQYLGRILRPAPGKVRAKVYDYVDPVGVLQAAARSRAAVYEKNI